MMTQHDFWDGERVLGDQGCYTEEVLFDLKPEWLKEPARVQLGKNL